MKPQKLDMLLAEDDENDILLFRRTLEKVAGIHTLRVVSDGEEAIAYLRGDGKFADREEYPFPNMLILDMKMPRKTGLDVLKWLNAHEDCSIIPAMILSSSALDQDIRETYRHNGNAYFTKPSGLEEWESLLSVILEFWSRCEVPDPPAEKECR